MAVGRQAGRAHRPHRSRGGLENDFLRIALVAIEFGGLAEGRGYSQAHLLRKRFKFTGELRAVGKIQRDQLFYLARCGFDASSCPRVLISTSR